MDPAPFVVHNILLGYHTLRIVCTEPLCIINVITGLIKAQKLSYLVVLTITLGTSLCLFLLVDSFV